MRSPSACQPDLTLARGLRKGCLEFNLLIAALCLEYQGYMCLVRWPSESGKGLAAKISLCDLGSVVGILHYVLLFSARDARQDEDYNPDLLCKNHAMVKELFLSTARTIVKLSFLFSIDFPPSSLSFFIFYVVISAYEAYLKSDSAALKP